MQIGHLLQHGISYVPLSYSEPFLCSKWDLIFTDSLEHPLSIHTAWWRKGRVLRPSLRFQFNGLLALLLESQSRKSMEAMKFCTHFYNPLVADSWLHPFPTLSKTGHSSQTPGLNGGDFVDTVFCSGFQFPWSNLNGSPPHLSSELHP